jgi:ATP adenylyltransferase
MTDRRMKHLFSPWRSAYIKTFSKKKHSHGCLFCRILKEKGKKADAENLIVWRGKFCFVVMNRYPYNSGHLMIVPYRHTSSFAKLSGEEHGEIMAVTGRSIKALEKISNPQGFNFGANLGRTAGAGIDKHVHFHLVPRWNGDTNFMPVLNDVKLISENMADLWSKLKQEMKAKK